MEALFELRSEAKDASNKKVITLEDNSGKTFDGIQYKINSDAMAGIRRFVDELRSNGISDEVIGSLTVQSIIESTELFKDAEAVFASFRSSCTRTRPMTVALREAVDGIIGQISQVTTAEVKTAEVVVNQENVEKTQEASESVKLPVEELQLKKKPEVKEHVKVAGNDRQASKVLAERLGLKDHFLEAVNLATAIQKDGATFTSVALAVNRSNPEEALILHLSGKTENGVRKTLSSLKKLDADAIESVEASAKLAYPKAKVR